MFSRIWDSRGAGLVEGAIISPLLFLITFSIMEFGTMLYVHLALVNGVAPDNTNPKFTGCPCFFLEILAGVCLESSTQPEYTFDSSPSG